MPNPERAIGSLLVLGGARSGKSRYAQSLAESSRLRPVLIATAQAPDAEMALRIARHAASRDPLNQALAEACEAVVLVSAGIALRLKPVREPNFRF